MEAFDICDKLLSQRGHFYVCGDVSMAEDVCRTLQVIPLCLSIVKFSYTVRVVERQQIGSLRYGHYGLRTTVIRGEDLV